MNREEQLKLLGISDWMIQLEKVQNNHFPKCERLVMSVRRNVGAVTPFLHNLASFWKNN